MPRAAGGGGMLRGERGLSRDGVTVAASEVVLREVQQRAGGSWACGGCTSCSYASSLAPNACCVQRSQRPVSYTHLTLPTICSV
eukprot:14052348-Alexandrium_andersonii.AAC.1